MFLGNIFLIRVTLCCTSGSLGKNLFFAHLRWYYILNAPAFIIDLTVYQL